MNKNQDMLSHSLIFEKVMGEKGILLRMNRSIQSEGAFGVIKQDYNLSCFSQDPAKRQ